MPRFGPDARSNPEQTEGWDFDGFDLEELGLRRLPDSEIRAEKVRRLSAAHGRPPTAKEKAAREGAGLSYSHICPETRTQGKAGVDTARFLFHLESDTEAALDRIAHSRGKVPALDGTGEDLGLAIGYTSLKSGPGLWVEGRPIQLFKGKGHDALMKGEYLPYAEEKLRAVLGEWGFRVYPEGVARLDLTTSFDLDGQVSSRDAILRGCAALRVSRRKTELIYNNRGRGTEGMYETCYFIGKTGKKYERVYAEAMTHKESSPGAVRFEAQCRFTNLGRRQAWDWDPSDMYELFGKRFEAVGKASEGVVIGTSAYLQSEIARRVGAGEMTTRQAERVLGYLQAKALKLPYSRSTEYARDAELDKLGLVTAEEALGEKQEETIPLQDVFSEVMQVSTWN